VFAVYAVALLLGLLLLGTLSDTVGRKPIIMISLLLVAGSLCLFTAADGVAMLVLARVVQGFATGLATTAVSAALLDQQPASRPGLAALVNAGGSTAGLAAGALLSGALVQYGPYPTRLIYLVLAAIALLLVLMTALRMTETVERGRRTHLAIRIGVSRQLRRSFLTAAPCLVATWGLSAFYLSLGPSLVHALTGSENNLLGGAAVALLMAAASLASIAARPLPARVSMIVGCVLLALGSGLTGASLIMDSPATFYVSTLVAGAGFGAGFVGALRTLINLATPDERGSLVAAIYTVAYLAFSVPAVLAGELTTRIGLHLTSVGYSIAVAVLALTALTGTAASRGPRSTTRSTLA
jgi:MFS family permease